jgi:hypothetical protein
VKEHLVDFAKMVGAIAAVGLVAWHLTIKPEVEKMRQQDRAANAYAFSIIATAVANRDTATLTTIARYGMPSGVPGR